MRQWPAVWGRGDTSARLVAAICVAEVVLVFIDVGLGVLLHALALGAILSLQARRASPVDRGMLVPLALVPLIRILSLTVPLPGLAPIYWTGLVGVPVAVAAILAARTLGLGRADLGFGPPTWLPQVSVAAVGVPAGFLAWRTGAPDDLLQAGATPLEILAATLLLVIFVAVLEEFVFRGVIQAGLSRAVGRGAILLTAILYGSMYLGSLSFEYAALMMAVGLLHGILSVRTGSLFGVVGSHAILVLGAFFVWPAVLG